ncbi:MAG: hypothetical protein ACREIC_02915 [Limisphaerales bacterium]
MIGTSLNQYQVTARLGAGGMGEVFRGQDTRLNRKVQGQSDISNGNSGFFKVSTTAQQP